MARIESGIGEYGRSVRLHLKGEVHTKMLWQCEQMGMTFTMPRFLSLCSHLFTIWLGGPSKE